VKQAQQPNPQRNMRIEHVFCSTDQVAAAGQSAREVEREQSLEKKQARSLPGENERTFEPETRGDQYISQVAEEEKILQTVLAPIDGHPDRYPHGPEHLHPERNPHDPVIVWGSHSDKVKPAWLQLPR